MPAANRAGKKREATTERALRACTTAREAAYVVKILVGDIRIGLREGLVLDAIALAFMCDAADVRRASMAASDAGAVAVAARAGRLAELAVRYHAPIGFMLASPIAFGSSYRELADYTWLVEDKFDGIRAQAHVHDGKVALYSRNFRDVARAFPDVVRALADTKGDAIFDGEIVAKRDGIVLPFRYLQTRLQRVDPTQELIDEIPAQFVAFDILAAGERFLLDEPLVERRAALAESIATNDIVALADWQTLEPGATPESIAERFEAARERGHEGLMLKRTDAPYIPGRRGKWWLKLKRELSTLDVVVTRVEWGHGKRSKVLSDYTFAVRTSAGRRDVVTDRQGVHGTYRRRDRRDDALVSRSSTRSARRPRTRRRARDRHRDRIRYHSKEHVARERLLAALPAHRTSAAR